MLTVVSILQRLRGEAWVSNFVRGLTPAVAVLMVVVAWQVFSGDSNRMSWVTLLIAGASLAALMLKVPPPLVLLAAGLLGVFFFR
jgi:chromate transport protein ChrA